MFRGWARMALQLQAFNVVEVRKPRVGENKPAAVTADITLDTSRASQFHSFYSIFKCSSATLQWVACRFVEKTYVGASKTTISMYSP